jgi:hypothetical protein
MPSRRTRRNKTLSRPKRRKRCGKSAKNSTKKGEMREAGMSAIVGAMKKGPPTVHLPTQPGISSVLTKEGVKTVKSMYPITRTGYRPPDSELRTLNRPSFENPFYKNAIANAQAVQTKYCTRHAGTYTSEKHLSGWDKRERTYPAPLFSGIQ